MKLVAAPKLPFPSPGRKEMVPTELLALTRSSFASPLKSPAASAVTFADELEIGVPKVPSPLPGKRSRFDPPASLRTMSAEAFASNGPMVMAVGLYPLAWYSTGAANVPSPFPRRTSTPK